MLAVGNQYSSHPLAIIIHNPAQILLLIFFPHRPIFIPEYFSAAIDKTFPRKSGIFRIHYIDNSRRPCHFDTGNAGRKFRIVLNIITRKQGSTFTKMQVHTTLDKQSTYFIIPRSNNYRASSLLVTSINSGLDSRSTKYGSVIPQPELSGIPFCVFRSPLRPHLIGPRQIRLCRYTSPIISRNRLFRSCKTNQGQ